MDLFYTLDLNQRKHQFLYLELYHFLRELILEGKLKLGTQLPSTRIMADRYNMNRNTIKQVYEMLLADGYVSTFEGSGTFVAYSPQQLNLIEKSHSEIHLSAWAKRIPPTNTIPFGNHPMKVDFAGGGFTLSLQQFPVEDWKKSINQALRELNYLVDEQMYYHASGLLPLREAIASYLMRTRGMKVYPEQIMIINGVMHGIGLLSQLLINPGDQVVVEEPSFGSIQRTFRTAGAELIPAPVEPDGFQTQGWTSRLAYVTPSHQYPTGTVMPLQQRLQLLQWAKKQNAIIIEDDYDSEFRRTGRPIEPLKVLDYEDRVVFLGTFAKSILPSLRIGYAVLPQDLMRELVKARNLFGAYTTSIVEQMAVANFIKTGKYERHLRKMRRVYGQKYDLFLNTFAPLKEAFDFIETDAGLHIFATWKHSPSDFARFEQECLKQGIRFENGTAYYINKPVQPKVIFGFSHLTEEQIHYAAQAMWEIYNKMM